MFANGPTIVTNGLVLALDAGDKNSYVSGSTTWLDLTGVNNGTLTNGPTFNSGSGGSIVFDGTNDYISTINNIGISGTSTRSMFAWIYPTELTTDQYYSVIKFGSAFQAALFELLIINDSLSGPSLVGHFWGSGQAIFTATGRALLNNFSYIGLSYNGSAVSVFLNGIRLSNQSFVINTTNSVITLGKPEYSGHKYYKGDIYSAQFYNRELTDIEVLQNYNATKGRFGLI